ncbi:DUF4397 domain-containing protein [Halobaculum limi]|uniref:DUF4397 domain-containing protein n=1 Tax=Halobaculum limi TaxID=3031916 RepID=UPI002404BC53|nr:DUF4397 domain-containing protein [Halobaculum sp. YSMS11]
MLDLTRRGVLGGIAASGVLLAVGTEPVAATEHTRSTQRARLRVIHASPDAPDVDVRVRRDGDDSVRTVASDLYFGAVEEYRSLPAGSYRVSVAPAGERTAEILPTRRLVLDEGADYTAVVVGEVDGDTTLDLAVFEDDNNLLDATKSRLRVIHASPDASPVGVTVAPRRRSPSDDGIERLRAASPDDSLRTLTTARRTRTLFDGVSYGQASDAVEVASGRYEVGLRHDTDDGPGSVLLERNLGFTGGVAFTLLVLGYHTPDDAAVPVPLSLSVAGDATPGPATVTFDDQRLEYESGADTVTVTIHAVGLADGGFVALHDPTLFDSDPTGSVVGVSEYLGPGWHTNVEVDLGVDDVLDGAEGRVRLAAMAYRGTDADRFSVAAAGGPYVDPNDVNGDGVEAVLDAATVRIERAWDRERYRNDDSADESPPRDDRERDREESPDASDKTADTTPDETDTDASDETPADDRDEDAPADAREDERDDEREPREEGEEESDWRKKLEERRKEREKRREERRKEREKRREERRKEREKRREERRKRRDDDDDDDDEEDDEDDEEDEDDD